MCRVAVLFCFTAALLLGSGCGSHAGPANVGPGVSPVPQVQAPVSWGSLPPPSALHGLPVKPRTASYAEADLTHNGADYATNLINQHVAVQGTSAVYSPVYTGSKSHEADVALALYTFTVPGYDRAPLLRSVWSIPPADPASVWYGLANWTHDRWDWYRSPADFKLSLSTFTPYLNFAGDLLLVVARTGADQSTLESVRLAGPLPSAALWANPAGGAAPLSTTLDASGSSAAEGSIVKYEFDPGDGTFQDNAAKSTFPASYSVMGRYTARVRVTDSQGGRAIAQQFITVTGPWAHTYTRGGAEQINGLAVAANGDIFACGSTFSGGGGTQAAVWKYNPLGDLLWVRCPVTLGAEVFLKCAIDTDGNLILCGYLQNGGLSGVLEKWTPDGQPIWTRSIGGAAFTNLVDVLVYGTEIYAVGSRDYIGNDDDIVALRISPDAQLAWSRRWTFGTNGRDEVTSCAFRSSMVVGRSELALAGFTTPLTGGDPPPFTPVPIVLGWDETGSFIRTWQLGDGTFNAVPCGIRFENSVRSAQVILLGQIYTGSGNQQFLMRSNLAGVNQNGVLWGQFGGSLQVESMAFVPSVSGYVVCDSLAMSGNGYGCLIGLDPASLTPGAQLYWDAGNTGEVDFSAICPTAGGVVIGGKALTVGAVSGTLMGSTAAFTQSFQNIAGNESDAGLILSDTNNTISELTDGQQDVITGGMAAMVRYEPMGP